MTIGFAPAQTASTSTQHAGSDTATPKDIDIDTADARLLAKITDTVEAHIADSDFNVTRLHSLVRSVFVNIWRQDRLSRLFVMVKTMMVLVLVTMNE